MPGRALIVRSSLGVVVLVRSGTGRCVMVGMPVRMHVRSAGIVMDVNHPRAVLVLEQAGSGARAVAKGEGKRRRQDAKKVDHGDAPPCPQPPGSPQAHQH